MMTSTKGFAHISHPNEDAAHQYRLQVWHGALCLNNMAVSLVSSSNFDETDGSFLNEAKLLWQEALLLIKRSCKDSPIPEDCTLEEVASRVRDATRLYSSLLPRIREQQEKKRFAPQEGQNNKAPKNLDVRVFNYTPFQESFVLPEVASMGEVSAMYAFFHTESSVSTKENGKSISEDEIEAHSGLILYNSGLGHVLYSQSLLIQESKRMASSLKTSSASSTVHVLQCLESSDRRALALLQASHIILSRATQRMEQTEVNEWAMECEDGNETEPSMSVVQTSRFEVLSSVLMQLLRHLVAVLSNLGYDTRPAQNHLEQITMQMEYILLLSEKCPSLYQELNAAAA